MYRIFIVEDDAAIAQAVGYESQSKFAKAFADQFRLTPLEYRREGR